MKKPCVTLRDTTEWVETIELGANRLLGLDVVKIVETLHEIVNNLFVVDSTHPYGDGNTSQYIINELKLRYKDGKILFTDNIKRENKDNWVS